MSVTTSKESVTIFNSRSVNCSYSEPRRVPTMSLLIYLNGLRMLRKQAVGIPVETKQ